MPKCKDSRKCILRGTARDKQECLALQEVYEDGKCPFCKESRSDINGFTHRPAVVRKIVKKHTPNSTDTYTAVLDRIQLVANRHGAEWRNELKFLESVKAELEALARLREDTAWRPAGEEPDDGQQILATVVEDGADTALVRIGRYKDGDYEIYGDEAFYVFAWKPLCDPWEGVYEAEDTDEATEAD